ncbi:ABC transporter ATP-binding protein [Micromonospora auratinigra]|uniref:Peptide/nickel transport system ATP-binding protein n=1 Tax=Micromonospora auratinigra TaxID=261654 RepID=A0A1A8ZBC8_9ACTN|nr:ABC transporter ATP-binding protein [Micromonospora auratinigra]SBT41137.1 peptide/nickel transport system ATP-binding protein [Micromonospora auratinigra]
MVQRAEQDPYLRVRDLRVRFDTEDGVVRAVDGVSFSVARGRTLGIVGESGSGKSVTSLAILGLHGARRTTVSGEISIGGRQLVGLPEEEVRRLRGRDMAMIFQDPLSALHPYYTVGRQIAEAYRVHHPRAGRREARTRAVDMLDRVGIPQPAQRYEQYPHEFSGGMRQRAMIAMALVNDPDLLIADEPTTALDVTVQAQILDLLADLQAEFHSAVVLITHDLGVVSQVADDVLVMYGGRAVEQGSVAQVLRSPQHPYTWGLLSSVPSLHGDADADLVPIKGNPPSLINLPSGCAFHPRCRYAGRTGDRSRTEVPELRATAEPGHDVACHLPEAARQRIFREEVGAVDPRSGGVDLASGERRPS